MTIAIEPQRLALILCVGGSLCCAGSNPVLSPDGGQGGDDPRVGRGDPSAHGDLGDGKGDLALGDSALPDTLATWRFDSPWPETLDNTAPFDEAKSIYGGQFTGNVHFDWDCLRHSASVGRNGPNGSAEIRLAPQPVPAHAINSENRQYNYRCELFRGPFHAPGDGVGIEKWFGYSVFVPSDWTADVVDEGITQIHAGVAKPRMIFVMAGTSLDFYHRGALGCGSDGDQNFVDSCTQANASVKCHLTNVAPGNWYDIVIRVVAADSKTPDGTLQVWAGMAGTLDPDTPTADVRNTATVYDCSPQVGTIKLGVYKYTWHEQDNSSGPPVEPKAEQSIANNSEERHYCYDNLSVYVGSSGFNYVNPSRELPPDP